MVIKLNKITVNLFNVENIQFSSGVTTTFLAAIYIYIYVYIQIYIYILREFSNVEICLLGECKKQNYIKTCDLSILSMKNRIISSKMKT